jgi:putative ABC transport system substrate-binding protein
VQQTASLFDHLVGAGEQRRGHLKAERLGGLQVDQQLDLGGLLDRKVGWLLAFENAARIVAGPSVRVRIAAAVALAAKAATTTVPTVFTTATNPVEVGLVASLSRPGGNVTGATQLNVEIGPKRLELVRELIPTATIVGLLVNPTNPAARALSGGLEAAARTLGLQLDVLHASTERDIDDAFATLVQRRATLHRRGRAALLSTFHSA